MTEANSENFLNPAVLLGIKDLDLLAKTVINGYFTGLHRSNFKGTGIEFVQYRNYTQGDDFKYVDWKSTAKTDKFFIKVFEEETNMDCQIILDLSSSMNYDNPESLQKYSAISKIKYSKMISACLAYLAHKQGDRLGLTIFTDKIENYNAPSKTKEHLNRIFYSLEKSVATGNGINENIYKFISENLNNRGILFLISDCLSNEDKILQLLYTLKYRNYDCVLVHLLHYDELMFPFQNAHQFIDMESKATIITNPETIRGKYQSDVNQFCENIKNKCLEKEIDYLKITTNESIEKILIRYLNETRKLYR